MTAAEIRESITLRREYQSRPRMAGIGASGTTTIVPDD